jgi:hypothetical protein
MSSHTTLKDFVPTRLNTIIEISDNIPRNILTVIDKCTVNKNQMITGLMIILLASVIIFNLKK